MMRHASAYFSGMYSIHCRMLSSSSNVDVKVCDVIIAGGGMIGSAMAGALGHSSLFSNKDVLLLEAAPETIPKDLPENYSSRVVALNSSTKQLLSEFGAWDVIRRMRHCPVRKMQVWEACSDARITFSSDNSVEDIAHIVENDVIQTALNDRLRAASNVEVRFSSRVRDYTFPSDRDGVDVTRSPWATVTLDDNTTLHTKLLVGSDGFKSKVRSAANISTCGWDYEQRGVCAVLQLAEASDNNVAWQRFLPSGPIAMLPLDATHSCLVWSTDPAHAQQLLETDTCTFVDAVNNAFCGVDHEDEVAQRASILIDSTFTSLGLAASSPRQLPPMVCDVDGSSRAAFPLGLSHAHHYVKARVALVGDSAHRLHPLAGQGANLGFGDVACLRDTLISAVRDGADIGALSTLLPYETGRQRHNVALMAGVDGLSWLYGTRSTPAVVARTIGLRAVDAFPQVKNFFRRQAQMAS